MCMSKDFSIHFEFWEKSQLGSHILVWVYRFFFFFDKFESIYFDLIGYIYIYFGCVTSVIFLLYYHAFFLNRWYGFADARDRKMQNLLLGRRKPFASVNMGEEKPFDFFRTFFGMLKTSSQPNIVKLCWMFWGWLRMILKLKLWVDQ